LPKTSVRANRHNGHFSAPRNTGVWKYAVLIGTPTMGQIRIEWHNAVTGLIIPINWQVSCQTPIGFHVADAQNMVCKELMDKSFEWLFLLEDDVIPPCDLYVKLAPYIQKKKYPIVSGLYNLKSTPPQPLVFRGHGNGAFTNWKMGEKVWCDGVPTGCLLVHASIIHEMAKTSQRYELACNGTRVPLLRIFETPRKVFTDPDLRSYQKLVGTSDLKFCDDIIAQGILKKAGWKRIAEQKYPFLVDTTIHCQHIDRSTGQVY